MPIYTPPGCISLDQIKDIPQIRLGIQGFPGTGKTWAALTFPNVIVANLDRGLGAHQGRSDVIDVPLYDMGYCKTVNPGHKGLGSVKDTLMMWIEHEGRKLSPEQTLVWDGCSTTQKAYHKWVDENKLTAAFLSKDGKFDARKEWGFKIKYFDELFEALKGLKCHLVFLTHETEKKEEDGGYRGKIRALLSGQSGDQMVKEFTDWFRQLSMDKPKDFNEDKPLWGMNKSQFKEMCDSFSGNTVYFWQTEGDDLFDAKRSSLVNAPRFMPASYKSFQQYRRKITNT